jgi:hypothetical protein
MSKCELIEKCIFFDKQMAEMPSTATAFKNFYCEQGYDKCARYMVGKAVGFDKVPDNLFPGHRDHAAQIIKG